MNNQILDRFTNTFKRQKENLLTEGITIDSRIKETYYNYLYERNLDWALILGITFLVLPYIGSPVKYYLVIKLVLFMILIINLSFYLKNWKLLEDSRTQYLEAKKSLVAFFNKEQEKLKTKKTWDQEYKRIINEIKNNEKYWLDFFEMIIEFVSYKNRMDNLFNKLIPFSKTDKLFVPQLKYFLKTKIKEIKLDDFVLIFCVVMENRIIPIYKLKNYYKLTFTFVVISIFFIIQMLEISFGKELIDELRKFNYLFLLKWFNII